MLGEYGARKTGHAKDAVNIEGVRCEGDVREAGQLRIHALGHVARNLHDAEAWPMVACVCYLLRCIDGGKDGELLAQCSDNVSVCGGMPCVRACVCGWACVCM